MWRIFLLVLFSSEACWSNPHLLELGLALGFGPLRRITWAYLGISCLKSAVKRLVNTLVGVLLGNIDLVFFDEVRLRLTQLLRCLGSGSSVVPAHLLLSELTLVAWGCLLWSAEALLLLLGLLEQNGALRLQLPFKCQLVEHSFFFIHRLRFWPCLLGASVVARVELSGRLDRVVHGLLVWLLMSMSCHLLLSGDFEVLNYVVRQRVTVWIFLWIRQFPLEAFLSAIYFEQIGVRLFLGFYNIMSCSSILLLNFVWRIRGLRINARVVELSPRWRCRMNGLEALLIFESFVVSASGRHILTVSRTGIWEIIHSFVDVFLIVTWLNGFVGNGVVKASVRVELDGFV